MITFNPHIGPDLARTSSNGFTPPLHMSSLFSGYALTIKCKRHSKHTQSLPQVRNHTFLQGALSLLVENRI